ncbi:MAG: hypothetical protein IT285_11635 [Bdellovibrionales bacterium]|nr:hypothetical protein [Bdellovibrionales bacterium]
MPRFEQLPDTRRPGAGWTTKPGDASCETLNSLPYHTFHAYCDGSTRNVVLERTTVRMQYSDDGRGGCTGTEVKSVARIHTDRDCLPDGTTGLTDAQAESEWHKWQKARGVDGSENALAGKSGAPRKPAAKPAKKAAKKKPSPRPKGKPSKKAARKKSPAKPKKKARKKAPKKTAKKVRRK